MVSTELLRRYPLFAGQNHYMLEEIAMLSSEVTKTEGEWLFHENEEANKLYLVLDGAVALTLFVYLNGEQQHLASSHSLGKNEIVGWSSIVTPHQLLDDNPEYGYHFLRQIAEVVSERFMLVNIQIMSLMADKENDPMAG